MPQTCEGTYGQGWVGEYPSCTFDPGTSALNTGAPEAGDFTGTLGSLDYGQELEGTTHEDDWEKYFDAYDPAREEMLGRAATTDVGQLGEAWGLESTQLLEGWTAAQTEFERQGLGAGSLWDLQQTALERQSTEAGTMWGLQEASLGRQETGAREAFGLQREELGAQAGAGFRQARQAGASASRRSGLARSGTAERMQRTGERDIMGQYGRGVKRGEARLGQTLAGLGEQRAIGQEALTQAQAGYASQIGIGQEQLSQTLAGLGYSRGPGGALTATGGGQLGAGQLTYDQAIATGQLGLQQATTDIYQGLESDIYGERDKWKREQRSNLNTLLGMGIYNDGNNDDDTPPNENPCNSPGQITCPDGSCQSWDDSPGHPCDNYGGAGGTGDCEPPAGGCAHDEYWDSNNCRCEWLP
jgi:hypothetical protein